MGMRIFVTGGSGYLGSAVVAELAAAGHAVVALARRSSSAKRLRDLGAEAVTGDVADPVGVVAAAAGCEAVVHLAQSSGAGRAAADRAVVEALLAAPADQPRLFCYTSVLFVLGDLAGREGTEATAPSPPPYLAARAALEQTVLAGARDGLTTAVLRPGMVYGGGSGGMVSEMFQSAIDDGAALFFGDGSNHWSLVHREDVARLVRLICERRAAGVYHAVDDEPLTVREIAEIASTAAGRGGAVRRIDLDAAVAELGDFARALCLDQPVRAPASAALGWEPRHRHFRTAAPAAFQELLSS